MKSSIDPKNNAVTFPVNTKLYSKEVVYKACYVFIDRMYIFLDVSPKKDVISVTLEGKSTLTKKGIEKLEGEFVNELLNSLVRENVSKRNQKVLEQIVGGAMGAALGLRGTNDETATGQSSSDADETKEIEAAVEALRLELEAIDAEDDYEGDVLGIRTVVVTPVVAEKPSKKKTASPKTVTAKSAKQSGNKRHAKKK